MYSAPSVSYASPSLSYGPAIQKVAGKFKIFQTNFEVLQYEGVHPKKKIRKYVFFVKNFLKLSLSCISKFLLIIAPIYSAPAVSYAAPIAKFAGKTHIQKERSSP